ncbi:hypothetical protein Ancab_018975 [Ancistrocladus abbreviatus]
MGMECYQLQRSSYNELLKVLEADIQHANALRQGKVVSAAMVSWILGLKVESETWSASIGSYLLPLPRMLGYELGSWAAAVPMPKTSAFLQMKLVYDEFGPPLFFLLQCLDGFCTCLLPLYQNLFYVLIYEVHQDGRSNMASQERKATIREFYAVILPSLLRLHDDLVERSKERSPSKEMYGRNEVGEGHSMLSKDDQEREDECGICLEPCTKMVLPGCCHAMCINCYHNWNTRSESCPFCRGGLKRVKSDDLWVLPGDSEMVDSQTVLEEDLSQFYHYIQSLPKYSPDALSLVYYEYLI